jgi:MHS family citrate/tricarballylate:H+ symporter-like MFS transporter
MAALSNTERKHQIWSVVRVSSGNFLEMYDFFVFGYYASAIGKAFFPTGSDFAQLMLAFMTFGAGFLMRPLGGIFLGAYIDSYGRRNGLMLTLGLMAVGTISIALVPGYATLGALAPVIVVIGRLIQGFSAAPNSAACRSTSRRSQHRATRAFMSVGNPAASRSPSFSLRCWESC